MEVIRYVRWRLSPAGRACYRDYALSQDPARVLAAAPARRVPAQAAGYARSAPLRRGARLRPRRTR
jgi:hypothetical protein